MRARMLALISTAVLAGGGTAVTSCGSDDEKSDGEAQVNVGQAAKATAAKGTARMTMRMRMSGLGLPEPLKGSYRLSDVIAGLPAEERADAREALDSLERIGGQETGVNNPTPAELWVDEDGVTRRMRATSKLPAQAGTPAGSLAITYALRDFGAKLDTSGPPGSERYDATDDLKEALESFSGTR